MLQSHSHNNVQPIDVVSRLGAASINLALTSESSCGISPNILCCRAVEGQWRGCAGSGQSSPLRRLVVSCGGAQRTTARLEQQLSSRAILDSFPSRREARGLQLATPDWDTQGWRGQTGRQWGGCLIFNYCPERMVW